MSGSKSDKKTKESDINLKIQTIFTGVFISLAGGITSAVKQTGNKLEIEVVNLWPNRLIGDEQLPDDGIQNGHLNWRPSSGDWKILFFMCRNDEGIVDYLDPDAVTKFTEMTHDEYYKHFGDYFGTTIIGTFFDEPTMYRAQGRCWTPSFNRKFQEKYGFSPALYYPALWYDIGEETQEARNYLFGFRSELYAEGYTKVVGDWSRKHGLWATGHQDNEEVVNAGDIRRLDEVL